MAVIECSEINQVYNELLIAFTDCNKIKNSDLRKMLDLIMAVSTCANGGTHYDSLVNEIFEPEDDTTITYEQNNFHSINVLVASGNMVYNDVSLGVGDKISIEFTTLNDEEFEFLVTAGSKVLVTRIMETV